MTCEEFRAVQGTFTPDTPASRVMAAWRHCQSCDACTALSKKAWDESTQSRREAIKKIAPLVALDLAIRAAYDPEIGDSR